VWRFQMFLHSYLLKQRLCQSSLLDASLYKADKYDSQLSATSDGEMWIQNGDADDFASCVVFKCLHAV